MASTFKNAGIDVGTSRTTLFTSPANTQTVLHALYISNIDGTDTVFINIEITIDGGTTYKYIAKTVEVPADSTLTLDKPINLEAGDIIAISASHASRAQAVCSALEITV
jgi:hypothetical protein